MACPTTAAEIEAMSAYFAKYVYQIRPHIDALFPRLFERFMRVAIRRRPFTDDMVQMLDDLGMELPEFSCVSLDGLTFNFRPRRR